MKLSAQLQSELDTHVRAALQLSRELYSGDAQLAEDYVRDRLVAIADEQPPEEDQT